MKTKAKEFMLDFERTKLMAEAKALSKLSLEQELTDEQFKRYKEVCRELGIHL